MSSNSTSFTSGPTREVQPGDTPDLNDGLLSRKITNSSAGTTVSIVRGQACQLVDGEVTVGTTGEAAAGSATFVPVETVNNSIPVGGATPQVVGISGVTAPQRVAVTWISASAGTSRKLDPGDYVKIVGTAGKVASFVAGTDSSGLQYGRFLGIEAALLDQDPNDPFDETLTPGIVPDQSILVTSSDVEFVIWIQLVEAVGTT